MRKIVILGSKGMLGQMVKKYFKNYYEIIEINERYTYENRNVFLHEVTAAGEAIIINCIGAIKQKINNLSDLIWVNTILPTDLRENLHKAQYLIHPSTDCVFSGQLNEGKYQNKIVPDAFDEYGWSKYMGEVALKGATNAMVVRVSIIGPDEISLKPKGLFGWYLSNPPNSELKGFLNHYWNGITTLEWCTTVHRLIEENSLNNWTGKILQLGTEKVYSKKTMLEIFQKVYKTNFVISDFICENKINRCLEPDILCPDLYTQMQQLYLFTNYGN